MRDPAGSDAPEDIVPAQSGPPVTRQGDLWALGRHRLLCGDTRSAGDLDRLMDGGPRRSRIHRPALQRCDRRQCMRPRYDQASRIRIRFGRDEQGAVHRISCRDAQQSKPRDARRGHCLRVHGLAPHGRAARRRPERIHGAQESLRLEQDEWRHGRLLQVQARAGLRVQAGNRAAHQQLRSWRDRTLPHQRLGLCGHQLNRRRSCGRTRDASHRKAGRVDCRCDPGLLATWRDRARCVRRIGIDADRRGEDRPIGAPHRI